MPVPDKRPTRRQCIAFTASLGAFGIAGLTLSNPVQANVKIQDFHIPDKTHNTTDGEIQDVEISVDVEMAIDASEVPDSWTLELQAGRTTTDPIARVSGGFSTTEQVRTETISGSLLTSSQFEIQEFRPTEETIEIDVLIGIELEIEHDGEVVSTSRESITRTLEVVDPATIQVKSELGGEGEIMVQT